MNISFKGFVPSYNKYLSEINSDESVTKFVSFNPSDSRFIFLDDEFVGCYKTMLRDDDLPDREIYIGIKKEFRGKGIAKYVLSTLTNNIFESDNACEFVHVSIDKDNIASINLAKSCGFEENKELEEELRENKDDRTLVFSSKRKINENKKDMSI